MAKNLSKTSINFKKRYCEQNYDTSDLKISDALTVSESGLYFQQIHPLLTLQNMSCIAPDLIRVEING